MVVLFVLLGVLLLVSIILMVVWSKQHAIRQTEETDIIKKGKPEQPKISKQPKQPVNIVHQLKSDADVHKFLSQPSQVLVFIYSSDCVNCEAMHPIMKEFAAQHPDILCGQINWTSCESLCEKKNIDMFPTLLSNGYTKHIGYHDMDALKEIMFKQ